MVTFNETVLGKMIIEQNEKEFEIQIRQGNCLAVFIYEFKNEQGDDMYGLYSFFADEQHLKNIIKNNNKVFFDNVVSIELNCKYKECLKMLKHIVKYHKVTCYYK